MFQHAGKIVWRMETAILLATIFLLLLTINRWKSIKQEQIVLERSASLILDPGRDN